MNVSIWQLASDDIAYSEGQAGKFILVTPDGEDEVDQGAMWATALEARRHAELKGWQVVPLDLHHQNPPSPSSGAGKPEASSHVSRTARSGGGAIGPSPALIAVPTVRQGGTARGQLVGDLLAAINALHDARTTLQQAAPHARDYPEDETLGLAVLQHAHRVAALRRIAAELQGIAEHIQCQE